MLTQQDESQSGGNNSGTIKDLRLYGDKAKNLRARGITMISFSVRNISVEGRDVAVLDEICMLSQNTGEKKYAINKKTNQKAPIEYWCEQCEFTTFDKKEEEMHYYTLGHFTRSKVRTDMSESLEEIY